MSEPITLLFDEVHDDDNWIKTLKILYDEARTAFILFTGPSVLLLNQTADLARRMRIEKIYPFKFTEFVAAKTSMDNNGKMVYPERGLSIGLKEAFFYSETPEEAFKKIRAYEDSVNEYFNKINSLENLKLKDLRHGYISYQNIPNFLFYRDKNTINDSILDLNELS